MWRRGKTCLLTAVSLFCIYEELPRQALRALCDKRYVGGCRVFFFGPLRWPPLWIWLSAIALMILFGVLTLLGISIFVPTVIAVVVILLIAAPRRVEELGAKEMRDSTPDE